GEVDVGEGGGGGGGKGVVDQAQLNRDRLARLWEQQLIARADLDDAVSALRVAEGRYQDALEEVQNRQGMLLQRRSEVELARQQNTDTGVPPPTAGARRQRQAAGREIPD